MLRSEFHTCDSCSIPGSVIRDASISLYLCIYVCTLDVSSIEHSSGSSIFKYSDSPYIPLFTTSLCVVGTPCVKEFGRVTLGCRRRVRERMCTPVVLRSLFQSRSVTLTTPPFHIMSFWHTLTLFSIFCWLFIHANGVWLCPVVD